ncbi:MAG: DUF131 domain-containing protein [Fervidicoccaceae archaeon]
MSDLFPTLLSVGLLLVLLGVVVLIAGSLALTFKTLREGGGEVETGGIIFVGPIPIVWGTTRKIALSMLLLALVLTAALALVYLLLARGARI